MMEKIGELDRTEMYNIFNMGTGMVIAVEEKDASAVIDHFNSIGEKAYTIGVVTDQPGIQIHLK
jgi:phosphoribosylformylglycinamidine cyclo-ligase